MRVSDSGIRQLVQAVWLESDLIVHLSLQRHPAYFCSPCCAFLKEKYRHTDIFTLESWIFIIVDCCFICRLIFYVSAMALL